MIIGETETILHYHDLYDEDYDDYTGGGLLGLFRKKTPKEKEQRQERRLETIKRKKEKKEKRKEDRHQRRLDGIKRRSERKQARAADPTRGERRKELFQDITDSISGAVSSITGANIPNSNPNIATPSFTPQQATDDSMGFGNFGKSPNDKKEDHTALYVIGGVVALGVLIWLKTTPKSAIK